MHLKHDKWEFFIHNYVHKKFFLPCYQTLKLKLCLQMIFFKSIEFSSHSWYGL